MSTTTWAEPDHFWHRASRGAKGRNEKDPFRCECGRVVWRAIDSVLDSNDWPECCSMPMALLPSDEADALRDREAGK